MNKRVFGRKLSRERSSRELLFVGLVRDLVLNGKIKTTKAKAKSVIGLVDRLVVLAKKDTLASKRQILKKLKGNKVVSKKLWTEVGSVFKNRPSGFTRIVPLTQRKGDMAEMVRLEWVETIIEAVKKNPKSKATTDKVKKSTKTIKTKSK